MFQKISALALVVALAGVSVDAYAGMTRREAVQAADADNNNRLDGKEAKTLKKNHRTMYDNLVEFCDKASEAPKKMGVDLPENPSKDQLECKKKHISKPFLLAWFDQVEADQPASAPAGGGGGGSPTERANGTGGGSPTER